MTAIKNNNESAALFLIDNGANVKFTTQDGSTPLHLAAEHGSKTIIQQLLGKGAYIDTQTNGCTPLYLAAQYGRQVVTRFLIDQGANKDVKCKNEYTPLHIAVEMNHLPIVQILVTSGANKEATNHVNSSIIN
jgi:ankyrin repeat protein